MALCVTGHGFGHAARACAVAQEIARLRPDARFLFVGEIPDWFLAESLPEVHWRLRRMSVDVAPVQRTSLQIDLPASVERVRREIPVPEETVEELAATLRRGGADIVVCDISAAGLLAGRRLGLSTVLVESFTWDWIFRRLDAGPGALTAAADWLEEVYSTAELRLQPRPRCATAPGGQAVGALAREPRAGRERTRARLGVGPEEVLALLSMGGVPWRFAGLEGATAAGLRPVVVGEVEGGVPEGVLRLPHHSGFHHPDLVAAADVVVGKLGYSTLAEAWQGGCGYAYVERTDFPEIPVLEAHARTALAAAPVSPADLEDGAWAAIARDLARRPSPREPYEDGRPAAARAICARI